MGEVRKIDGLTVVIQAGGESKRMGTSKALVSFLGQPLIMQGFNRLNALSDDIVITTNEPDRFGFLQEHIDCGRLRLVSDGTDQRGALIGIHTALKAANRAFVSLTACDMVFPSAQLIMAMHERIVETGADVIMPVGRKGIEPFHAVYRKDTCLGVVERALEDGDMRAVRWTNSVHRVDFDATEFEPENALCTPFVNVNTPDELRDLEKLILDGEVRG